VFALAIVVVAGAVFASLLHFRARYDKPRRLEQLLATCARVVVHLDPRAPGVELPRDTATPGTSHLVLLYGRALPRPIPDLDVRREGIAATLSFHGKPARTFVPWPAVFAMACVEADGGPARPEEDTVWTEALPPDLPVDESNGHP
jgi:hypothetical protein